MYVHILKRKLTVKNLIHSWLKKWVIFVFLEKNQQNFFWIFFLKFLPFWIQNLAHLLNDSLLELIDMSCKTTTLIRFFIWCLGSNFYIFYVSIIYLGTETIQFTLWSCCFCPMFQIFSFSYFNNLII